MRQIFNQGLPNFFIVDSSLEIRELMRKSSTLLFVPPLALQRKFVEDALVSSGMNVHRIDEAMWAAQQVEHLAQCRARVRHKDNGVLLTSPVPGYVYIGA